MKKVIQQGDTSQIPVYLWECQRCHCQFEYGEVDAEGLYYDRDAMPVWYVSCPDCGDRVKIEMPKPIRIGE